MISKASHASARVWAPPLLLIALLAAVEFGGGEPLRELWRYDRGQILAGQWWRLWTANFVHLGWYHWLLNEIGLIVLVLLCPEPLGFAVWSRRLLLLCPGMTLGLLWLVPGVNWYVGMSGVIHGFFVLGLVPQVLKKDLIAGGCLAYLLGKIGWELFAGTPVSDEQALGGAVLVQSHLFGSMSALLYGLAFRSFTRLETWNPWK